MTRLLRDTDVKGQFIEHDLRGKVGSDEFDVERATYLLGHATCIFGKQPNSVAAVTIGFDRILCVFNEDYGDPDDLPFDLVHRKHPIRYRLSPDASAVQRKEALDGLMDNLVQEGLRVIVTSLGLVPTEDAFSHATTPLDRFSFVDVSEAIANTKTDGFESDYVFWYNNPCAWLRLLPASEPEVDPLAIAQADRRCNAFA